MAEYLGEKRHQPSDQKLQKAKQSGQVPKSQDLNSAVLLLVAALTLLWVGGDVAEKLGHFAREVWGGESWRTIANEDLNAYMIQMVSFMGAALLPIFASMVSVAIFLNLFQNGFSIPFKRPSFEVGRLNPIKGVQRIFSISNFGRFMFGLLKVAAVSAVAIWCLWQDHEAILGLTANSPGQIGSILASTVIWSSLKIGAVLLILAIIDYMFQRWKFTNDQMMTDQELRDELKEMMGDAYTRQRRKEAHQSVVRSKVSEDTKTADFIATNPTELAVAIKYDPAVMNAPKVVAKGAGSVAQRIRRIGLENDIPIIERKELARALYFNVEVGQEVPPDHYATIAELLKYVYDLKGKTLPNPAA